MYNRNGTYIYFHISVSEVHVMNLQQLRYAVEVAKTGSITAAAKNLYMGQPNLSKSIRELDIRAKYGVNVIAVRENGKVHVTLDANRPLDDTLTLVLLGENDRLARVKP